MEDREPTTRPSKRTESTSGGPAWTNFGSAGDIPTSIRTLRIVFCMSKKSLIFPCESKYEVIPELCGKRLLVSYPRKAWCKTTKYLKHEYI